MQEASAQVQPDSSGLEDHSVWEHLGADDLRLLPGSPGDQDGSRGSLLVRRSSLTRVTAACLVGSIHTRFHQKYLDVIGIFLFILECGRSMDKIDIEHNFRYANPIIMSG